MSARNTDGWIKVHRVLTAHNLWTSESFTRGQAWVDLLMLANHAPGIVRKQGLRIDLDRGDVGWSEIELSARWRWSRGKVRRFLDELLADNMIVRKNNTNFGQKTVQVDDHKQDKRKFVISIVNYDKFQDSQTSDETSDGTGDETSDGQATDKRRYKNKNDKNDKNNNIPEGLSAYADFARNFQNHVIAQQGAKAPAITDALIKKCAEEVDKLVRIDGHTFEQIKSTMKWAVKDSFWAPNAMSLAALRKKGDDGRTKFQKILAAKEREMPVVKSGVLDMAAIRAMVAIN